MKNLDQIYVNLHDYYENHNEICMFSCLSVYISKSVNFKKWYIGTSINDQLFFLFIRLFNNPQKRTDARW